MQVENPLVSIIVLTYNSSEYVLETLESAKLQSYQNIELIISDDCSTDNTVEMCKNWIEKKNERFKRTELLTVKKNTCIPANANRGLYASNGELVKLIAGDDTMESTYITKCVEALYHNPNCVACFTNSNIINANSELIKKEDCSKYRSGYIFDDIFFLKYFPKGPSFIYKRKTLFDLGLYDENIWVEDYLMLMKLTYNFEVKHINEYLVNYRKHSSNSGNTSLKLLDSQLQSISFFENYAGYEKRKREIILNKLFFASKFDKNYAVFGLFKNISNFYQILYIKSLIYTFLYWPALRKNKTFYQVI